MAALAIVTQLYVAVGTFLAYPAAGLLASLGLILSGMPVYLYYNYRKRIRTELAP